MVIHTIYGRQVQHTNIGRENFNNFSLPKYFSLSHFLVAFIVVVTDGYATLIILTWCIKRRTKSLIWTYSPRQPKEKRYKDNQKRRLSLKQFPVNIKSVKYISGNEIHYYVSFYFSWLIDKLLQYDVLFHFSSISYNI